MERILIYVDDEKQMQKMTAFVNEKKIKWGNGTCFDALNTHWSVFGRKTVYCINGRKMTIQDADVVDMMPAKYRGYTKIHIENLKL